MAAENGAYRVEESPPQDFAEAPADQDEIDGQGPFHGRDRSGQVFRRKKAAGRA